MSPAGMAEHVRCGWKQPRCAETSERPRFLSTGYGAVIRMPTSRHNSIHLDDGLEAKVGAREAN